MNVSRDPPGKKRCGRLSQGSQGSQVYGRVVYVSRPLMEVRREKWEVHPGYLQRYAMYIDLVISWDLTMKNGGLMGFNQQTWWF